MKLLLTNHQLKERGGTELFTLEVATELHRRGHEVAVFTTLPGKVSEMLVSRGIPCLEDPVACPFRPDVIHGQHHLEAMAALCAWPEVPSVYFMHGAAPWEEQPPQHPRILAFLAPSVRFGIWMEEQKGLPRETVGVVPNFFDPEAFPVPDMAKRRGSTALVFHNTMDPKGDAFAAIREGCTQQGFSVEGLGASFGRPEENPSDPLSQAAVVFAAGRSAIEAMACGCAVILIGRETIGPLVTPENFVSQQSANFCLAPKDAKTTASLVRERLSAIRQAEVSQVTEKIRATATLAATVDLLETHYRRVMVTAGRELPTDPARESAALSHYLTNLASRVKQTDAQRQALLDRVEKCTLRAETWKLRAENLNERLQGIEGNLQKNWFRRRLWRELRRFWS